MDITLITSLVNHTGLQFPIWIKQKILEIPYIRPLVLLLKTFLSKNKLNDSFEGGISSYVLTLMVSAFLKSNSYLVSLAHCFLEILKYYGDEFKETQMIIVGGEYITISKTELTPNNLYIVDPFINNTNAASSVRQFANIRSLFMKIYNEVKDVSEQYEKESPILSRILQP